MQCCSCVKPHLIRITLKLKLNLKLRKTETFRSIVRIFGRCVISLNSTFDCGVVFILWKLLRWTIIENRKRLLAAAAAFVSFVINPPLNGGGGKLSYCTCIKMSWDFAWGGKEKANNQHHTMFAIQMYDPKLKWWKHCLCHQTAEKYCFLFDYFPLRGEEIGIWTDFEIRFQWNVEILQFHTK